MVAEALKHEVLKVSRNAAGNLALIGLPIVKNGPICLSGGPVPKDDLLIPGDGCNPMLVFFSEAKLTQCLADNMVLM